MSQPIYETTREQWEDQSSEADTKDGLRAAFIRDNDDVFYEAVNSEPHTSSCSNEIWRLFKDLEFGKHGDKEDRDMLYALIGMQVCTLIDEYLEGL